MKQIILDGKAYPIDKRVAHYIKTLKGELKEKDKVIQGQQDLIDELWKRVKK